MGRYDFKACNPMKISRFVLVLYSAMIGCIHGIGEILQAGSKSNSLLIHAIDVANPDEIWHAGLPAFSIIPDLMITGIITVLISIAIVVFTILWIERDYYKVLPIFFILLFLFGGGFVPPLIGMISSTFYIIKRKSNRHNKQPSLSRKLIATSWIYLISVLLIWFPISWIMGWFFPTFRLKISPVTFIMLDIVLPVLILVSAKIKINTVACNE